MISINAAFVHRDNIDAGDFNSSSNPLWQVIVYFLYCGV